LGLMTLSTRPKKYPRNMHDRSQDCGTPRLQVNA
jgi:hypothetical protein